MPCSTRNRHTDERSSRAGKPGRYGRRADFEPRWPEPIKAAARVLHVERGVPVQVIADFFVTSRHTIYSWLRAASSHASTSKSA